MGVKTVSTPEQGDQFDPAGAGEGSLGAARRVIGCDGYGAGGSRCKEEGRKSAMPC